MRSGGVTRPWSTVHFAKKRLAMTMSDPAQPRGALQADQALPVEARLRRRGRFWLGNDAAALVAAE